MLFSLFPPWERVRVRPNSFSFTLTFYPLPSRLVGSPVATKGEEMRVRNRFREEMWVREKVSEKEI
jgi:hypothetical protein